MPRFARHRGVPRRGILEKRVGASLCEAQSRGPLRGHFSIGGFFWRVALWATNLNCLDLSVHSMFITLEAHIHLIGRRPFPDLRRLK